jgi:hypothetical protein
MNTLVAVHGLVLYLAVGWKAYHLSRAPRDQPLRWVTACLACAALAYPAGIIAAARPSSPAAPWLTFAELAFLLATGYALVCFFLFSMRSAPIASARARLRAVPFAVMIGVQAVSAALTPAGTRMNDLAVPAVAVSYLAFDIWISYLLADAWVLAREGKRGATRTLRRGLQIASAGLALMVAGASLLAVNIVFHWTRIRDPAWLGPAGNLLVIPGIVVFIIGVCYPGVVMRVHALRVWARHRRVYRQLAPLWKLLHQAFPQDALTRAPASSRWRDRLSPRGVHWRYYRRIIECRDGLVRISPHLAQRGHTDSYQQVADHLLAAIRSLPATAPEAAQAVPIAVPSSPGLDADASELVRLSRELAAASARTRIPKPRRGTSMERTTTT